MRIGEVKSLSEEQVEDRIYNRTRDTSRYKSELRMKAEGLEINQCVLISGIQGVKAFQNLYNIRRVLKQEFPDRKYFIRKRSDTSAEIIRVDPKKYEGKVIR